MPAITATVTPTAALLIALHDLRRQRDEIAAAYKELDFAGTRVLEEQEVGYLDVVADRADAMLAGHIVVTVRIENAYATGEAIIRVMVVAVPAPADGEDLDDWAADHLLDFTGEGPGYSGIEAIYEVAVTACDQRPDLLGANASAQG